jgi:hypothetical protein
MVSSPYIIDDINVIIATLAAFITFDADPQLSGMVNKFHPCLKLFTISDLLTYDGSCIHPDLEKKVQNIIVTQKNKMGRTQKPTKTYLSIIWQRLQGLHFIKNSHCKSSLFIHLLLLRGYLHQKLGDEYITYTPKK